MSAVLLLVQLALSVGDGYVERFLAGEEALQRADPAAAEQAFSECLALRPESPTCAYYLARARARMADVQGAESWLRHAVKWGYDDVAMLAWEPDFERLRQEERVERLIAGAGSARRELDRRESTATLEWNADAAFPRFSPDGSRIVCARGGEGFLWDVGAGRLVAVLRGFEQGIAWARFSPDGKHLVTSHDDRVARVWDARTGAFLHRLAGESPWEGCISFSADGVRVLISEVFPPDSAGVWEVATGKRIETSLPDHDFAVLSPDGERVLSDSGLWSLEQGSRISSFSELGTGMYSGGFSRDGSLAFILSAERGAIRIVDGTSGEPVRTIGGEERKFCSAAFVGEQARIAVLDARGVLEAGDARSDAFERYDWGLSERTGAGIVAASRDGRWLLLVSWRNVAVFDLENRKLAWSLSSERDAPFFWGGDISGPRVALSVDGRIELWDVTTGERIRQMSAGLHAGLPAVHPRTSTLMVPLPDGRIQVIDPVDGGLERSIRSGVEELYATSIGKDGNWRVDVAAGGRVFVAPSSAESPQYFVGNFAHEWIEPEPHMSADGAKVLVHVPGSKLAVWDRAQAAVTWSLSSEEAETMIAATLSASGRLVAIADRGRVSVRDAETGGVLVEALQHPEDVSALLFAADDETLVTGCDDGYARVWRLDGRQIELELFHGGDVFDSALDVRFLALSGDGSRLLSTTGDFHRLYVWDLSAGGKELLNTDWGGGNPTTLGARFAPDGRSVAVSGSFCGTSSVWHEDPGKVVPLESCPVGLDFTADGRFVVGTQNGATCCYAANSLALRWLRVQFPGDSWLLMVPSLHVRGEPGALRLTHVVFEDGSLPLDSHAELLLDPRKVEASLAGVAVLRPRLPRPPLLEARVENDGQSTLSAAAKDDVGVSSFLVDVDGARLEQEVVDRATSFSDDGRRADVKLPVGVDTNVVEVRALGRSRVLSRIERLQLRP